MVSLETYQHLTYRLLILLSVDGLILDLSNIPLLHSLSLSLPYGPIAGSLATVVKLLTHRKPCPPLHNITLVFDAAFRYQNSQSNTQQRTEISGEECCALYRKIDGILGDQPPDEGNVTSLTLKASYGLPKPVVDQINGLFQAEFPELHRKGRITIDFTVWGKQFPTQLWAHP